MPHDNNLLETSDQMDEDTLETIKHRFSQAETKEEARRTHEFLKRRLEQVYNNAVQALTALYPYNRTEEPAPSNEEAQFARIAKEKFAMIHQEALQALGCRYFQEFAQQQLEMRSSEKSSLNPQELAQEAMAEHRASALDYSARYMN